LKKLNPESEIYFYCENNESMPPNFPFELDGKKLAAMTQGETYKLRVPLLSPDKNFCFGEKEDKFCKLHVNKLVDKTYYKVIFRDGKFSLIDCNEAFVKQLEENLKFESIKLVEIRY
jgi:hypothetical protein